MTIGMGPDPKKSAAAKRSHKKLDPEIKAIRAINRALDALPDDEQRKRVIEWTVARALSRTWFSIPRFHWITGDRRV